MLRSLRSCTDLLKELKYSLNNKLIIFIKLIKLSFYSVLYLLLNFDMI